MKKIYVLIVLAIMFSFAVQVSGEEKSPDTKDYLAQSKADVVSGSLDATSPIYEKIKTAWGDPTYDAACSLVTEAVVGDRYYAVYPFYSSTAEPLDISLTSTGGSTDGYATVYCEPFDPVNPGLNIKAVDDDDGPSLMPAFDPSEGFGIEANTQYYLVVSTYSVITDISFDITFGGDFVLGTPAPPPPPTVPLSNWAFAIIGILALTFVFIKFRK